MDDEEEEARERARARRAAERALLELDRMPEPGTAPPRAPAEPPAAQPPPQARPEVEAAPTAPAPLATGPASAPDQRWPAPEGVQTSAASSAGVYRPPGWVTAGQAAGRGSPVVESEGVSLPMCGFSSDGTPLDQHLLAMAGLRLPTEESFGTFFRTWFEVEFFPNMSESLKRELVQRAKSKGFFSGLSSQVKKWAMANTDARLQSDAWCSYFEHHAPPRFKTFGCVRTASMNLGSQAAPCWVTFWGLPNAQGDHWVLPPWTSTAADIGAVVDELDGRGGMTALVAAAA